MTHPHPGHIGDGVEGPGLPAADPDPQVARTRLGHGPLRYLLHMGILGLGVSFRRAPVELLERLAYTDDDLTKAYRFALDQPGI